MTGVGSNGVYTCGLLLVKMNVGPAGVWKLLPRMNQTYGGLHFFLRSSRGTEFEGMP